MMARLVLLSCVILLIACEPTTTPMSKQRSDAAAPIPDVVIEPKIWGETTGGDSYTVQALAGLDGRQFGVLDSTGSVVMHLVPEIVVEAGAPGGGRPRPHRGQFKVIRLDPGEGGGFVMYARSTDLTDQAYDLRIEQGPQDPRIHVSLVTKWQADTRLYRLVLRFQARADAANPRAIANHLQWVEVVEPEWVSGLHAPNVVSMSGLSVHGRTGTENIALRRVDDHWLVDLEGYHFDNHPIDKGDACDETLDGSATVRKGTKMELRADFVLGAISPPVVVQPYPDGRQTAIALAQRATFPQPVKTVKADAPDKLTEVRQIWFGDSVEQLACDAGRFATLRRADVTVAWGGESLAASGPNLLAATEVDARRPFAFRHPGLAMDAVFATTDEPADPGSLSDGAIAQLRAEFGIFLGVEDLTHFVGRDASATTTVAERIQQLSADSTVWVAGLDELALRMVAIGQVDLDYLPDGVVRVRNLSKQNLPGLTVRSRAGTQIEVPGPPSAATDVVSFDLAGDRDQLVRLQGEGGVLQPARVTVVRDRPPN